MSSFACALAFLLVIIILMINGQLTISSKGNRIRDMKVKSSYTGLRKVKLRYKGRSMINRVMAVRLPNKMKKNVTKKLGSKIRPGQRLKTHKKKYENLAIKANRRKPKNAAKIIKTPKRRLIKKKKGKQNFYLKKSKVIKKVVIKKTSADGALGKKKSVKIKKKLKRKQGSNTSTIKTTQGKRDKMTTTESWYDEHNKWHQKHKPFKKDSNSGEDIPDSDFGGSYIVEPLEDGFKMKYTDSSGKAVLIDQYEHVNYNGLWFKDLSQFQNNPSSGKTRDEFVKELKRDEVPHEGFKSWRKMGFKDEIGNIAIFNKKKEKYLINGTKWMEVHDYNNWIRFEKLKKRIKKYGGNPDEYDVSSICYTVKNGKCYQKGDLVCERRDWTNYCIKGYYPITRYNIHGKIESLEPERFSIPPARRDYDRMEHYRSGSKQACVTGSEQCVPLDRVLRKYPNLGAKIEKQFPNLLNKQLGLVEAYFFNRFRGDNGYIYVDSKRVNSNTDALSILLNLIKEGDDAQCIWLIDMFPFLAGPFNEFAKACSAI